MIHSFSFSAFLVFGLCFPGAAIAASDKDDDYIHTSCAPSASCLIEYDHLSTQDTDPFVLSVTPRERKAELRQVERFKTVTHCLVRAERNSETPDLRKMDWQKMTSEAALEVCMFRIFASYGSPEKAKLWFEAQGLEGVISDTYTAYTEIITRVRVYNHPRETGEIYVSQGLLSSLMLKRMVAIEEFLATWSPDGVLRGVRYETSAF